MYLKRRISEGRIRRVRARATVPLTQAQVQAHVRRIFPTPVLVAPRPRISSEPYTDMHRGSRRVRVSAEIGVRKAGCFNFQLSALDVSTHGCRVELIEAVDRGERVVVRLPALEPLGAGVAWVRGTHAGLRFDRPLHPAVFDQLVDRLA
jgi:PilZ domain